MVSDLQLIQNVKENRDSDSFSILLERHSGIYTAIVKKYSTNDAVNKEELLEDKTFNIYQYALDYDPTREMKFSSYIGQRVKYACQTLISKHTTFVEIGDNIPLDNNPREEKEQTEILEKVYKTLEALDDKRVVAIFKLRHSPQNTKETPWWKIGKALNISTETARILYYKHLHFLKTKITQ
jgi:RNA polymerase sigma factor (sigma-70 family)